MKREQLEYALARYGTPLYVFDLDILRQQIERIKRNVGEETGICYAMKANPFLTQTAEKCVDRIEVCSMGEFRICKALGIAPEKLFISGVLKKKEDLIEILDFCGDRANYTVESVRQFHQIVEWCDAHSIEKELHIHLYPRLTSGNQFGMDENTVKSVIRMILVNPSLEVGGIHYFSGTQKRNLKKHQKELMYLDEFLRNIEDELGEKIPCLEYGSGTAVPYFKGKDAETFQDEGFQGLAEAIGQMQWKGHVTIEMGRAIAALCGYYLTEIRDIKTNKEKNYCIVDGGNHQINYDGQIKGMYEPYVMTIPEGTVDGEKKWNVCGSLCTVNDVMCSDISLPPVKEGHVLVFERTGAYSAMEGMALFLSHELPGVVLYDEENGWKVARERQETFELNMPQINV